MASSMVEDRVGLEISLPARIAVVPAPLQTPLVDTGNRLLPHGRSDKGRSRVLGVGRNLLLGRVGGGGGSDGGDCGVNMLDVLDGRDLGRTWGKT